jgi:hypothetical protein
MRARSGFNGYNVFDYAMGCFVAAVWTLVSAVLVGALLLFAITTKAQARERYPGQYSQEALGPAMKHRSK